MGGGDDLDRCGAGRGPHGAQPLREIGRGGGEIMPGENDAGGVEIFRPARQSASPFEIHPLRAGAHRLAQPRPPLRRAPPRPPPPGRPPPPPRAPPPPGPAPPRPAPPPARPPRRPAPRRVVPPC